MLVAIKVIKTVLDYLNTLNGLYMPPGNMGVLRSTMPQIDAQHQKEYIDWLASQGIKSKLIDVPVSSLKLAQNEINKDKVLKMMQQLSGNSFKTPIIISKDSFVIDGSHRFVAQLNVDKYSKINAYQVDMNARDLLLLSRTFGRVNFRTVSGKKIDK